MYLYLNKEEEHQKLLDEYYFLFILVYCIGFTFLLYSFVFCILNGIKEVTALVDSLLYLWLTCLFVIGLREGHNTSKASSL